MQEVKNDAVAEGVCVPLTALVRRTRDPEVLKLSCDALGSLSQVRKLTVSPSLPGSLSQVRKLTASPSLPGKVHRLLVSECL
jgi:hypothetical protein